MQLDGTRSPWTGRGLENDRSPSRQRMRLGSDGHPLRDAAAIGMCDQNGRIGRPPNAMPPGEQINTPAGLGQGIAGQEPVDRGVVAGMQCLKNLAVALPQMGAAAAER